MKKIIFNNLLNDVTKFFILSCVSIGLIVWVIQAVNFLDFVSEDGHSLKVYALYTLLSLPKIFSRILLFIFFISLFYILIKYEENNELIIFWNFGVKKIQFINKLIIYSFIFFLVQVFLTSYLVPFSQDKARNFIRNSKIDFFPSLIKEKQFNDTVSDLTIFVDSKKNNGDFQNIFLKDKMDSGQSQIIFAESGFINNSNGKNFLVLENGNFLNNDNGKITAFNFKKTEFNLSKFVTKSTTYPKIQELPITKLFTCFKTIFAKEKKIIEIEFLKCEPVDHSNIIQELLRRVYMPIYLPLITLITSMLILRSKDNLNYNRHKFIIFLFSLIVIILSEILVRYADIDNLSGIFFLLLPLTLFTFIYLFLLNLLKSPKSIKYDN